MSSLTQVTQADFAGNVLESELPVVVDFTAAWCPPCRHLTPILEQIADEYAGQVKIVKLDTDAEPQITVQYGVQGMPTVVVFKDGQEVKRLLGLRTKSTYAALLDQIIGE